MAPFTVHPVLEGFKERVEAVCVQGDHLYVGTSTGNLHVYELDDHPDDPTRTVANLVEVKKAVTGRTRAIERIAFLRDINSLVILCDWIITLLPLPSLSPPKPLAQARNAMSFAIHTAVVPSESDASIKSVVTHLLAGCQKRAVLYTWRDGEAGEVKEWSLPHSPRAIAFPAARQAYMAYTAADIVLLDIERGVVSEVEFPTSTNAASVLQSNIAGMTGVSMNALAGLGNYMTLGLGAKAKPSLVRVGEGEVMITREHASLFFGPDKKLSRLGGMEWPAPPEDISSAQNYLLGVLPGGPNPSVHVRSSLSLQAAQTLPYPFATSSSSSTVWTGTATVRLLSSQLLAVTPAEKNAATALWMLRMRPWAEQVDELVAKGAYADALALVDTLDGNSLPDKDQRRKHIRALLAVSYFARGEYDGAIDLFIELETNPARVVALYPPNISGRLGVPREGWIELFGGTPPPPPGETTPELEQQGPRASIVGMSMLKGGLDKFLPSSASASALKDKDKDKDKDKEKDADSQSVTSAKDPPPTNLKAAADPASKRALETLMRYLSDRRQKATGALGALQITPAAAPEYPLLSQTPLADVWALPDAPPSALAPAELVRYAQIVYTALFKTYLAIRTTLVGPLCRIENWCEVVEVEEELRARGMFTDLIDLYAHKNMHDQALKLLKELSADDDDPRDKLDPTIRYLQKLPPSEAQTVFTWARWAFEVDAKLALNIFTLEESQLPRTAVADYLEGVDPRLCMRFIEHLIYELPVKVTDQAFHDRLADLYLQAVVSGPKEERKDTYDKLLKFISDPEANYRPDRLFGHLPSEDLFEAKAILLGRLGRHEAALEIYVYKLKDYIEAEEYCKRVHRSSGDPSIFPLLLRILLRASLLQPALAFISRQSPRLDAQETIKLLPPLVPAGALKEFLVEAVRQPIFDTRVVRDIGKARAEEVSRRLVALQERRVRVDDSRICPQCHKRIGGSVIAVHLPRGEVTHYQCREAFSKRLRDSPVIH